MREIKALILSILLPYFAYGDQPPVNQARLLLSHLRGGDFAHAGDIEAIDLIISSVLRLSPEAIKGPCLDVGCGFGGTADYLHKQTYSSVYGIDIDSAAINYAQEKYLETSFIQGDACLISDYFATEYFSFIYLFNVLYAIEDKFSLVKQLGQIARKDAILAIFDYTTENPSLELNDLAGKPMYPIVSSKLSNDLKNTGWEILEFQDLSSHFLLWYEDLLSKLENESFALSSRFSEEDILKVKVTFQTIKGLLSSSYLGGVVIFAKRKDDLKLL